MNAAPSNEWLAANQRQLMAALGRVRAALERHAPGAPASVSSTGVSPVRCETHGRDARATTDGESPSALAALCAAFGLSAFEQDLLLLCAGRELDSSFGAPCAAAQGDERRTAPTFSLALAALPGAHWSAITPTAPLRRWRLIKLGPGDGLTSAPLRVDERVLHHLAGLSFLDERLQGLLLPVEPGEALPPSQLELARRIAEAWAHAAPPALPPVIQLFGADAESRRAIAAAACATLGNRLFELRASDIPGPAADRESLARLWEREALLTGAALLVEADDDTAEPARGWTRLVETVGGRVCVSRREPLPLRGRTVAQFEVRKPTAREQKALWETSLGSAVAPLNGQVDRVVSQFNLSAPTIRAAAASLREQSAHSTPPLETRLWDSCRVHARPRLDALAQRIPPVAGWDDLVLPPEPRQLLREIAAQVRQRFRVHDTWGFASKTARGLGISALFAGASGTGKTMAAEVLARELQLDLYRIDLSAVVSKYIGETEKNLRRIFDAAEDGGAILLFDEADALFGKRSEVKDSHDRYANIEVSYLLQRMEAYQGLAILTTNLKAALDTAFLRRLRFVVQFPFPDAAQRAEIWRRAFPASTPTEGLEPPKLALLNVPGGNISNIALNAAFLAAASQEPVRMGHLLRAARSEYAKLEKPLTETEIKGWQAQ